MGNRQRPTTSMRKSNWSVMAGAVDFTAAGDFAAAGAALVAVSVGVGIEALDSAATAVSASVDIVDGATEDSTGRTTEVFTADLDILALVSDSDMDWDMGSAIGSGTVMDIRATMDIHVTATLTSVMVDSAAIPMAVTVVATADTAAVAAEATGKPRVLNECGPWGQISNLRVSRNQKLKSHGEALPDYEFCDRSHDSVFDRSLMRGIFLRALICNGAGFQSSSSRDSAVCFNHGESII